MHKQLHCTRTQQWMVTPTGKHKQTGNKKANNRAMKPHSGNIRQFKIMQFYKRSLFSCVRSLDLRDLLRPSTDLSLQKSHRNL